MKTWTCMIVDDEPDAHTVLQHFCNRTGFVTVLADFYHALEVVQFFKEGNSVDFMFLDINLPQLSGFDLLAMLQPQPRTIFTTAYTEYALQSFEHNVAGYLVKPIPFDRFLKAVNKLVGEQTSSQKTLHPFVFFEGLEGPVNVASIRYAESGGNYVKLHTTAKILLVHATMQLVCNRLAPHGFIRIHKQFAVPLGAIEKLSPDALQLTTGQALPVGISYRQFVNGMVQQKGC